jgi:type II secretory ATPase GspE/PulE/Tfp pilus assembly ATPase PilB-like protein
MFNLFGRSKESAKKPKAGSSAHAHHAHAGPRGVAPGATKAKESQQCLSGITVAKEVCQTYAELGQIKKILTEFTESVISSKDRNQLLAFDRGEKKVWLIYVEEDDLKIKLSDLQSYANMLIHTLRARGYQVEQIVRVTTAVMREVLSLEASQSAAISIEGRGEPLELFYRWIDAAVRCRASDVHILVHGNQASVKVRVDGSLEPLVIGTNKGVYSRTAAVNALAAGYNNAVRGSGSAMSQYSESSVADCMIEREIDGKQVLLRYQNLAAPSGGKEFGPKVVIRLLQSDATGIVRSFNDAGYAPSHVRLWKLSGRAGKGMTIVAGVTGSGKSTTLVIYIETLPDLEKKAVETVEDPIEYVIAPGRVHQGQVTRDLGDQQETRRRYGVTMKSLMRGDIDAVLIGEVRDDITARFLLQVAETGHLGMCSLHAHLISNIVPRLTNEEVGLTRQELTSPQIINLLVYQALVPVLCPECSQTTEQALEADSGGEVTEIVDLLGQRFGVPVDSFRWKRQGGCPSCNGRGTRGRTIVAEMWMPDRIWLQHVREGNDYAALMHYRSFSDRDFFSENMNGKTVFEHAFHKALNGEIDVRNCEEFEAFERYEFLPLKEVKALTLKTANSVQST